MGEKREGAESFPAKHVISSFPPLVLRHALFFSSPSQNVTQ